jgi:hypothetical protein
MEKMKKCFVICPIGEEKSKIRKRADLILKHIIEPVIKVCGFKAIRADKIAKSGVITNQVIEHIIDDPLVIADLTGKNPNVFYELAIRHAIRKPLIQIIQKGENIPFDVYAMRTIPIDHHDLDNAEEAKKEMKNQIDDAIVKKPDEIESPISMSLDLQSLRQSKKPEGRSMAEIISVVTEIRSEIYNIKKDLNLKNESHSSEQMMEMMTEFRNTFLGENIEKVIEVIGKLEHFEKELSYEKNINSVYFREIKHIIKILSTFKKNMLYNLHKIPFK